MMSCSVYLSLPVALLLFPVMFCGVTPGKCFLMCEIWGSFRQLYESIIHLVCMLEGLAVILVFSSLLDIMCPPRI